MRSLSILLPPPDNTIEETVAAIKRGDEVITHSRLILASEVDRLVEAFKEVKPGSSTIKTLRLIGALPIKVEDRANDCIKIWGAVKNKIQSLDLSENTLPSSVRRLIQKEAKNSKQISCKTVDTSKCDSPDIVSEEKTRKSKTKRKRVIFENPSSADEKASEPVIEEDNNQVQNNDDPDHTIKKLKIIHPQI